ncbi:MAG TPA: cyclic pyranopterin monophosphate synthase MoaC [Candidatus Nitrosotalea sp.]|nr:cyclic pyranopterin monophosphate synthase MoaC [Candidatus Nitrosotalea sp.]
MTHVDEGGAARMVDVGDKAVTRREASAESLVLMAAATIELIRQDRLAKGDALSVARLAGIMACKRTSELIPLCHPIRITKAEVALTIVAEGVHVESRVVAVDQTGVEMEALTAAAVAALTLIDMVKGVERGVQIEYVRLLTKSGGRSGEWRRE